MVGEGQSGGHCAKPGVGVGLSVIVAVDVSVEVGVGVVVFVAVSTGVMVGVGVGVRAMHGQLAAQIAGLLASLTQVASQGSVQHIGSAAHTQVWHVMSLHPVTMPT
jgi:hypothetical protein